METIFSIAILFVSVIIHEVSHGYAAVLLGDQTPRYANRLTLNPISHIDPFGTIIVPILLALINPQFVFGWAKPVPFNPYNLRGRYGEAIVAAAGPASNLLLALVFGLFLRFGIPAGFLAGPAIGLVASIVYVNIYLAIFNLVPLPPLDGSRLLLVFLPAQANGLRAIMDRYGLIVVLLFAFFFANLLSPVAAFLFRIIVGA